RGPRDCRWRLRACARWRCGCRAPRRWCRAWRRAPCSARPRTRPRPPPPRVGRHRRGIDDAKLPPPGHAAAAVLLLDGDDDVDGGDIVGVVARFHYGVAAVGFDEEIMIVAAEHGIHRPAPENRIVLFAAGMDHRH